MKVRFLIPFMLLVAAGCSVKYGEFEGKALRMETQQDHASLERAKGVGSRLTVVGDSGFPEWWIGNMDHTQVFLPKLKCITFYREDGSQERTECEEITPVDVENNLKGMDGVLGDRISSGSATELEASFGQSIESTSIWIEAMKQALARAGLDSADKQKWMDTLNELSKLLGGNQQ